MTVTLHQDLIPLANVGIFHLQHLVLAAVGAGIIKCRHLSGKAERLTLLFPCGFFYPPACVSHFFKNLSGKKKLVKTIFCLGFYSSLRKLLACLLYAEQICVGSFVQLGNAEQLSLTAAN